jgi:hypothetical protein
MVAKVGYNSRAEEVAPASTFTVGTFAAVPFAAAASCIHPFLGVSNLFGADGPCLLCCGVHLLKCNVHPMQEAPLSWAVPCPIGGHLWLCVSARHNKSIFSVNLFFVYLET